MTDPDISPVEDNEESDPKGTSEDTPIPPDKQPVLAAVAVVFDCTTCGEFEVLKSESTLVQFCAGCGELAKPTQIVRASVLTDGVWKTANMRNVKRNNQGTARVSKQSSDKK